MNLSGTIKRLKTGSYVVTRRTPQARVNGVAQSPLDTKINIVANIQPASGRDLQRLPEGMRQSETIVIFCETELHVVKSGRLPDLIAYNGKSYEVSSVEPWADSGNFHECLAVKVGDL